MRLRLPASPAWLLALLAATSLGLALLLKAPCVDTPWRAEYQYRHYCYTDLLPLWSGKGLDHDALPYLDEPNEYPVLTGAFMWVAAKLTTGLHEYLVLSFALLLVAGGASTLALVRQLPREAFLAWTLAPTVPLHGFTNWDFLAIAAGLWGWHHWRQGRPFTAALLFGLGGSAKLYPALVLPFLAVDAWRRRDRRGLGAVGGGAFLGLAVPNLLLALATPRGWWGTYRFHLQRVPDFETPWQALLRPALKPLFPDYDWGHGWDHLVGGLSLALVAASFLALLARSWRRRVDPLVAGSLFTLAFFLFSKVYSPQYSLWVLALLLLVRADWKAVLVFVVADAANVWIRYNLFTPRPGETAWNDDWMPWSRLVIGVRWLALAWATWSVLRRHLDVSREPGRTGPSPLPSPA